MIIDKQLELSLAQDIGAGAGTQVSTNTIDLSVARNIAKGEPMWVCITIDETFATSTSIEFQLVTDTVANLASPTVQATTGAIAIASLTAGRDPIFLPVSSNLGTEERYLGMNYVEVGSNSTAGQVTASLIIGPQTNRAGV